MSGEKLSGLKQVTVTSAKDLRDWLALNHMQAESVWLVTYKKAAGHKYVSYGDVVDEALCYGWIDSLPRKLDQERTMVLLSPRKPGSNWSRINREKVGRLIEEGRMAQPGLAAVQRAKDDGSWFALDQVDALIVPGDLAEALDANAEAKRCFERFPPSSRRGILEWIAAAKRPATRAARIAKTVELAAQNIKANHPEGRNRGPNAL